MLKGEVLNSFLKTLNSAKIKPYSLEEKIEAERKLEKILKEREAKIFRGVR